MQKKVGAERMRGTETDRERAMRRRGMMSVDHHIVHGETKLCDVKCEKIGRGKHKGKRTSVAAEAWQQPGTQQTMMQPPFLSSTHPKPSSHLNLPSRSLKELKPQPQSSTPLLQIREPSNPQAPMTRPQLLNASRPQPNQSDTPSNSRTGTKKETKSKELTGESDLWPRY